MKNPFQKRSFAPPAWPVSAGFLVVSLTVLLPVAIWLAVIGLVRLGILPLAWARLILGESTVAAVVRMVISFAVEIGLLLAVKRHYQLKLADFGLKPFNVGRALLMIAGLFAVFIGLIFIAYLIISVLFPQVNLNEAQKTGFELGRHGSGLAASFIVTVLIAPVIEEVYFRGFLLSAFSARWGDLIGIGLSSALFGILHMQVNVGIYTFILGILLALMYRRTRSIGPGILFHMFNNALAFYVLLKL